MVSAATRGVDDAIWKAFSIPRADSRIGINQMGRSMPCRVLSSPIMRSTSDTCPASSTLGMRIRSGASGMIWPGALQPHWQLIDAYHALARAEMDGAQRVAHQNPGRIFFSAMDGIFQIKNDCIGAMERGVDEILGLASRQTKRDRRNRSRGDGAGRGSFSNVARALSPANPPRRAAASIRAAITNGRAPSSWIATRALSTPSQSST